MTITQKIDSLDNGKKKKKNENIFRHILVKYSSYPHINDFIMSESPVFERH